MVAADSCVFVHGTAVDLFGEHWSGDSGELLDVGESPYFVL